MWEGGRRVSAGVACSSGFVSGRGRESAVGSAGSASPCLRGGEQTRHVARVCCAGSAVHRRLSSKLSSHERQYTCIVEVVAADGDGTKFRNRYRVPRAAPHADDEVAGGTAPKGAYGLTPTRRLNAPSNYDFDQPPGLVRSQVPAHIYYVEPLVFWFETRNTHIVCDGLSDGHARIASASEGTETSSRAHARRGPRARSRAGRPLARVTRPREAAHRRFIGLSDSSHCSSVAHSTHHTEPGSPEHHSAQALANSMPLAICFLRSGIILSNQAFSYAESSPYGRTCERMA